MITKFASMALLLALAFGTVQTAYAGNPETREAVIASSTFDRGNFQYKILAYDTKTIDREDVRAVCTYAMFNGAIILKSVEFKIFITADFSSQGSVTEKRGTVNVNKELRDCQVSSLVNRSIVAPVEIILPKISVSSQIL